jgi:hypothetical protein
LSNSAEEPVKAFAELKRAIMADGRTEAALGLASGVSRLTIRLWLDGKTHNPNIAEVDKVARALGYRLRLTR